MIITKIKITKQYDKASINTFHCIFKKLALINVIGITKKIILKFNLPLLCDIKSYLIL